MSVGTARTVPSFGQLIGEGFQHWGDHQRLFWMVAGLIALGFATLRLAELQGWMRSGNSTTVTFFIYSGALIFWQAVTLDEEWKRRMARRGAPLGFFIFCAAYGAAVFVLSFSLFVRIDTGAHGVLTPGAILMMALAESAVLLVVAAAFANFLLYLPAYVAGVPWGISEALRQAAGVRGRLTALALFCTFISLAGVLSVAGFTLLRLPDAPWVAALARGLAVLVDLLALYVAAYGLSRLFKMQSGWQP